MSMAIVGIFSCMLIVLGAYYAFAKSELYRLARYEYWSDRFYSSAKPLVANSDTPSNIISLIEGLNVLIAQKDAPIGIISVFKRKLQNKRPARSSQVVDEKFAAFFKTYPDLVRHAAIASHAGLLAASYVSWVAGAQARAILADVFSEMEFEERDIGDAADVREIQAVHRGPRLVPLIIRR
ncbi:MULTISPECIES: hypothetical protein [Rhodopseudomonas]|uniref:hypothetical protein n=1 Tax=Rhodopseudomonas TaxID=1073 RepID=UPI00128E3E3A|nr:MULTISPECIES: hypothetical protein [Rhodopseudomonas]MDF3813965.1 hypothetical protein [Rhodopseudomonas sp. BAL398]WOK19928.1 hypothetical protein RBJ75_10595 [Rhodopseudomonas sp. BAL398]